MMKNVQNLVRKQCGQQKKNKKLLDPGKATIKKKKY